MPIESYWVENYKAFEERAEVKIRPLTLLFGKNSVGKSALLRMLPLLSASARTEAGNVESSPLALKSGAGRGADFGDLRCQFSDTPSISFGLTWRGYDVSGVSYSIREMSDLRRNVIESFNIHRQNKSAILASLELPNFSSSRRRGAENRKNQTLTRYEVSDETTDPEEWTSPFLGLLPDHTTLKESSPYSPDFAEAERLLKRYLLRIRWIKALRTEPRRLEQLSHSLPEIAEDGSGAAELLAHDYLAGGELVRVVSDWYLQATGHALTVQLGAFGPKELFTILLTPRKSSGRGIHLIDVGEGMGQVLPVVVLLALAKIRRLERRDTLVFEHPELHLHPGAHAELAGLFCDVAAVSNCPRLMVETHSENFLLRVQLEIAKGNLDPARVAIFWVQQDANGRARIDELSFDALGRPIGDSWPIGMFSENVSQARQIVLARRNRS